MQQAFRVNAAQHETALVKGLGTLGAGADADCGERMTYAGEEAALLGQCTAVADHGKGVHLKAVVVMEAQRLMLDDTLV